MKRQHARSCFAMALNGRLWLVRTRQIRAMHLFSRRNANIARRSIAIIVGAANMQKSISIECAIVLVARTTQHYLNAKNIQVCLIDLEKTAPKSRLIARLRKRDAQEVRKLLLWAIDYAISVLRCDIDAKTKENALLVLTGSDLIHSAFTNTTEKKA
jgi:hypothetical protein